MNIFKALVKREVLDGKNSYIGVPVILAGITIALLFLTALGFGNMIYFDGMEQEGISNLGDAISKAYAEEPRELPTGVSIMYWVMSLLVWFALPFVIFFSLLGTLYEERRDRSILFWKSMPVADWQEVLAKLFTPLVVAPLIYLSVTIAAQLLIAIFLSIVVLFQGGPMLEMLPLGLMITSWFSVIGHYLLGTLWALPFLAWVLMVSAYASRMPFMWAVLPPIALIAVEAIFFNTSNFARWLGTYLGGWREGLEDRIAVNIDGPRDLFNLITGGALSESLAITMTSPMFWIGLIIAGGFTYGAIELRKRAT